MSKDKTVDSKPICFVLMPIADAVDYDPGHFGRVYEHLLKPAILAAGYTPVRADDTVKTDYIVVGIIQKIVESAMVVCDFSSRNPNVMYELGVRHAFNKPVVLVKDRKTEKIFDIQGLRYAEYDETLRIDAVNKDISKITSAILETAAGGSEAMNSIVQLAGIKTAEVPKGRTISADTQLILSTLSGFEKRLVEMERRDDLFPVTQTLSALARGSSKHPRDEFLTLSNGQRVRRGDILFHKGSAAGELLDWNLLSGQIGIKRPDGLNELVSMNSREFHELSLTAL